MKEHDPGRDMEMYKPGVHGTSQQGARAQSAQKAEKQSVE